MRTQTILTAAFLVVIAAGIAWAQHQSPLVEFPPGKGMARAGACMFPAGGWTIVDPDTSTAALSAALNTWSRYVVQCTTDSYIAPGTSAAVADTNDGYLPTGAWLEVMTTDTVRYLSVRSVSVNGDCRYIECL